jgi:Polysaccharide pyruvyl transferase
VLVSGDPRVKKALVAGWFSFEQMGASAGDLMARDLACEWLRDADCPYDVALAPPFTGGVDWTKVDPRDYSPVIFVCGPFGNGWPVTDFLQHFSGCRLIGLNLSMLDPLDQWNPFDRLWERDSSAMARPDMAFLSAQSPVPILGLVLIDTQPEYRDRDSHQRANDALRRLAAESGAATVNIDTRLDTNSTGLGTAAQIESLIARMDVVLTTRLHGTVLAVKNGVPALAVDSVVGGGKIRRQAEAIGWTCVLPVESLSEQALRDALRYCLSGEARAKAKECAARARARIELVRRELIEELASRA